MARQITDLEAKRLRFFAAYTDIGGDDSPKEKYRRYVEFCARSGMPKIDRNRFMMVADQLDTDSTLIHIDTNTTHLRQFIRARLMRDADSAISKDDLFKLYTDWLDGGRGYTRQQFFMRFSQVLVADGLVDKIRTVYSFNGVRARHFVGIAPK